ncbi:ribonuclease H-like domain-containing protein [Tanacetum coccineum]
MKIPIIRKGEYDIWSMRMRQYICHTGHNLWDGLFLWRDLEEEPVPTGETSAPPVLKTAKQLAAKRNQERVKSILAFSKYLMNILPSFTMLQMLNTPLWIAIKSRFEVMKNQEDAEKINGLESFKTYSKDYDSKRRKTSSAELRLEIQGYEFALDTRYSRISVHEKIGVLNQEQVDYSVKQNAKKSSSQSLSARTVIILRPDSLEGMVLKGNYLGSCVKGQWIINAQIGNPEILLQDHAVVDSGCSSHMTGNKAYLSDYADYNGGFMAFGSDPKGGIKREFSVARTPQQNGVAKRKNRTLIEVARTMLADSLLPIPFWAEAVNTACYGTGLIGCLILNFLTNSMNFIPVVLEIQRFNVDASTQDSYIADKDVQDSEDAANKEEQHQMQDNEKDLQDELEMLVTQELVAKAMEDVSRQAFEEEKRRIASQKKAAQATSTNQLSTDRLFVRTDRSNTPNVSAASTSTCANADESSFVYLGGNIPIDASTLLNADLPIDPNMLALEDVSDTLLNDGIFNGAYDDDEDVGVVANFNNMDNTIVVSPIPTLRIHKDHPKGQILGDPTSAV